MLAAGRDPKSKSWTKPLAVGNQRAGNISQQSWRYPVLEDRIEAINALILTARHGCFLLAFRSKGMWSRGRNRCGFQRY